MKLSGPARVGLWVGVFVLGLLAALAVDGPAVAWMRGQGFAELKARFEPAWWWCGLWAYGRLWVWVGVSVVVLGRALVRGEARNRALILAITPLAAAAVAGGLADGLKPFLCRMRPEHAVAPAVYAFVDFMKNFPNGSGLGLPSSHAAVSMGGAVAILRMFPRVGWVAVGLALGTCASRVMVGAHYPSDVYVGAWIGVGLGFGVGAWAEYASAKLARPAGQGPTAATPSP